MLLLAPTAATPQRLSPSSDGRPSSDDHRLLLSSPPASDASLRVEVAALRVPLLVRTPWKPASWEQESVSSFDYSAWSKSLRETMVGIDSVRQCLRNTKKVLPLLKEITTRDYFSFFAVNLITPCMYFPAGDAGCEMQTCEIQACRERDMKEATGAAVSSPRSKAAQASAAAADVGDPHFEPKHILEYYRTNAFAMGDYA